MKCGSPDLRTSRFKLVVSRFNRKYEISISHYQHYGCGCPVNARGQGIKAIDSILHIRQVRVNCCIVEYCAHHKYLWYFTNHLCDVFQFGSIISQYRKFDTICYTKFAWSMHTMIYNEPDHKICSSLSFYEIPKGIMFPSWGSDICRLSGLILGFHGIHDIRKTWYNQYKSNNIEGMPLT